MPRFRDRVELCANQDLLERNRRADPKNGGISRMDTGTWL
jgi:hypothetical protein